MSAEREEALILGTRVAAPREPPVEVVAEQARGLLVQATPGSWTLSGLRCELRRALRAGELERGPALDEALTAAARALREGNENKAKDQLLRLLREQAPELLR